MIGGTVLGAGLANAQSTTPADFFVEEVSGVPDSANCGDTVTITVVVNNYSSFGDTQEIELYGGYGSDLVVHDSQSLQLVGGEESYVRLESNELDQSDTWTWTIHTDVDEYPGGTIDVGTCSGSSGTGWFGSGSSGGSSGGNWW